MSEDEVARVAAHFADPPWSYPASPLYRALAPAVAADRSIHELLAERRPGQEPSFLLFGAVHQLLLAGADHDLRRFYPSIAGASAAPPAEAGPAFRDFCATHRDALAPIVRRRLVQTTVVKRACGLAFALTVIGRRCDAPVHLVEVGSSAGLLLRFDRYRLELGGRAYGDVRSPVVVRTAWRSRTPVPDLDARPPLASRWGIDLSPVDVRDPDERSWLRALVWPEDAEKARLLEAALAAAADDPPVVGWPSVQPRAGQMSNAPPPAASPASEPATAPAPSSAARPNVQRHDGQMSNAPPPAASPASEPATAPAPSSAVRPNVQRHDGQVSSLAGDAIDVLPELATRLPVGEPRVVVHFAVRMHVPPARRVAFDAAIDALGADGPLFHVWLEPPDAPHHPWPADERAALQLHGPGDARPVPLARADGHLEWLAPLDDDA